TDGDRVSLGGRMAEHLNAGDAVMHALYRKLRGRGISDDIDVAVAITVSERSAHEALGKTVREGHIDKAGASLVGIHAHAALAANHEVVVAVVVKIDGHGATTAEGTVNPVFRSGNKPRAANIDEQMVLRHKLVGAWRVIGHEQIRIAIKVGMQECDV